MDVFKFVKLPLKANDPTRRYAVVSVEGTRVAELAVTPPHRDTGAVTLDLSCSPVLSDAAREDVLTTARRFLNELSNGWGVHLTEPTNPAGLQEQPDGRFHVRLEFATV